MVMVTQLKAYPMHAGDEFWYAQLLGLVMQ